MARHTECQDPFINDVRLKVWALLCNGLLWFICSILSLNSIPNLLAHVRRVMPPFPSESLLSVEQKVTLHLWELMNGGMLGNTDVEVMTIDPLPNFNAGLLHWRVIHFLMSRMTEVQQEQFQNLDQHCFWDGTPVTSISERDVTLPSATVDSHLHPDLIRKEFRETDLFRLRDLWRNPAQEQIQIVGFVGNFVFPEHYEDINIFASHRLMVITVGLHPHCCSSAAVSTQRLQFLRTVLRRSSCRALGEIGLDYYRHGSPLERNNQKTSLKRLLPLAVSQCKPVVIHCRDPSTTDCSATTDCLQILKDHLPRLQVIHWHCFSGNTTDVATLRRAFPNLYFGLTGISTRYRGQRLYDFQRAVQSIPLDRLLLESDAPLLVPEQRLPFVETRQRNVHHSWTLRDVAQMTADQKGCAPSMILCAAKVNAQRVYGPF